LTEQTYQLRTTIQSNGLYICKTKAKEVEAWAETGAGELELRRSFAWITINGKESVQDVLISDFIERVLLGVVTLEAMALSLDPLTGKLKEKRLLLY